MDFKALVGKTIVWTGEFPDENGYHNTYLLASDGTAAVLPDESSDQKPTVLEDGPDVLNQLVSEHLTFAQNVLNLCNILKELEDAGREHSGTGPVSAQP